METTAGFYYNDCGHLVYAPTSVYFPDGTHIIAECCADYQYPVNGWTWYESEEQAHLGEGISPEEE